MLRKVGGCKNELKESLSTLLRSASIYHVRAKGTKIEVNIQGCTISVRLDFKYRIMYGSPHCL